MLSLDFEIRSELEWTQVRACESKPKSGLVAHLMPNKASAQFSESLMRVISFLFTKFCEI